VASKQRVFAVQSYGADRVFHSIAAFLDAAVGKKQAKPSQVF
jgi:hypothetical protein